MTMQTQLVDLVSCSTVSEPQLAMDHPLLSSNQCRALDSRSDATTQAAVRTQTCIRLLAGNATLEALSNYSGEGDDAREVAKGAWLLLAEVSAQEPSAPSWQFLQVDNSAP